MEMKQKTFNQLTGLIFLVVGLMHILRIVYGWSVTLGTLSVPVLGSVVGAVVALCLAYNAYKLSK